MLQFQPGFFRQCFITGASYSEYTRQATPIPSLWAGLSISLAGARTPVCDGAMKLKQTSLAGHYERQ